MSKDFNQANPNSKQSMIDLFVKNQSKLMAELGTLFSFEPKFSKLPTMGEDCYPDFESPSVEELKEYPLNS